MGVGGGIFTTFADQKTLLNFMSFRFFREPPILYQEK